MGFLIPDGEPELFLGRGYTGHEHLQWFGLINMNARLYDPAVGRFLSPDPYIQSPDFTQNFNRYSYCLNNPLKYTDPNGEFIVTALVIGGAILGAYLGGLSGNHGELNPTKWDFSSPDTYVGMIAGAVIGAVAAYGIAVPGSITFSFGLFANNSLGGIALSLGGITVGGSMSDWNFRWSTSAGGGGQYNFPDKNSSKMSNGSNHITNHNEQRSFERNYNSYLEQQLYNFSGMGTYADIASFGFELNQMALTPAVSSMSEYSQYMSLYRNLGSASRTFGALGTSAGGLSLYFDYKTMRQGDMSESRFGYHAINFGTSVAVGSAFGGPCGAAAGGILWGYEQLYDFIVPTALDIYWGTEQRLRNLPQNNSPFYW